MRNPATEFDDPKLAEIVGRLVQALDPERIYLFGSRARGEASADSDYDVVVVIAQAAQELYLVERQAYRALWGLGTPVDVVVMTKDFFERRREVVASLPATVEREGKLLYAA